MATAGSTTALWARRLGAVGVALFSLGRLALLVATPALLAHHVVALEALSNSAVAIVTGGALARVGRASLLVVVLAPLCGIGLSDIFFWWAGRRWGIGLLSGYAARHPGTRRGLERGDRWVQRNGARTVALAYFLPVPNPLLYLSCGAAEMGLVLFVGADVVGTLLWTGLLVGLGWGVGRAGVNVVDTINHDELWAAVAVVVGLGGWRWIRRRGGPTGRQGPARSRRVPP